MAPMHPAPPAPESGRFLLRDAIKAAGMTERAAAKEEFGVAPASLSEWLSGKNRPRPEHQSVALARFGVPREAWETKPERKRRERAEREALAAAPAAPPSSPPKSPPKSPKRSPPTRRSSSPASPPKKIPKARVTTSTPEQKGEQAA